MKTLFIAATALAFATPLAAQSPAQSLQGHAPHHGHHQAAPSQAADHAGHAQHQKHGQSGADHSKHANCCGDANKNGKMECCDGAQAAQRPCCAGHGHGKQDRPAQPSNQ